MIGISCDLPISQHPAVGNNELVVFGSRSEPQTVLLLEVLDGAMKALET